VPNPKFHIWQGSELRASFYSSDNKEISITDKQKICAILKTRFDSAWFAPTHESLSLLPEKPKLTNEEGRKYGFFARLSPDQQLSGPRHD
jgi:hypothetical protein